jgi:16S rRNA (cytosine1402-N4)-methyltransferase
MSHIPVLLPEVLQAFEGKVLSTFFEGTVGLGGHAKEILKSHPEIKRYFACDRDHKALNLAKETLKPWWEKVEWVHGPFAELDTYLKERKAPTIDGFFIDIGVSSMQFDEGERGFSFRVDAPLDMRMDGTGPITAEDLINDLPEVELARIFFEYGEEFRSRAAAKAIITARKRRRIRTTQELTAVLEPVLRKGKIHFATKVFQALRIAVNDELGQLKKGLDAAIDRLSIGGVLAVISFHSLEDRIVKWRFREEKRLQVITKKPIEATREEIKKNPRSRSAKLRVAEKICDSY